MWLNSKAWEGQNQTFGGGYHMIANYLSKVLAKQARLRHKMFMWYNTTSNYAYLQMTLLCKVLMCYQIGRDKRQRKSLVNTRTHPLTLYCNEKEIEGFGLWKRKFKLCKSFEKLALSLYIYIWGIFKSTTKTSRVVTWHVKIWTNLVVSGNVKKEKA